ncbi:SDR family oxidoreductase [Streptomyces sp. NBC_01615]
MRGGSADSGRPAWRPHCPGAGHPLGAHCPIARTFGSLGFDVALISRNRAKLDDFVVVGKLTTEGITAAAIPADVLNRDALTQTLKDAATQFGGIDVLKYSPVGTFGVITLTAPAETEPSDVEFEMNFHPYGAMAATKAVLPAMRETAADTPPYATGRSTCTTSWPVPASKPPTSASTCRSVPDLVVDLQAAGGIHVQVDVRQQGPPLGEELLCFLKPGSSANK